MFNTPRIAQPIYVEILLFYFTTPALHPCQDAPAYASARSWLIGSELLVHDATKASHYEVTDKGAAWIEMLLRTPLPEQRWVDPRGDA
jgi:hypothetical protein